MNEPLIVLPLIGAIDRVETCSTGTLISGWCLDLRLKSAPRHIELQLAGHPTGKAEFFFPRPDLHHLGLSAYACGFHIELAYPLTLEQLSELTFQNEAGEQVQLRGRMPPVQPLVTRGELETITSSRVAGWLYQVEPQAIRSAYLRIADVQLPVTTTIERPDLIKDGTSPRLKVGFAVDLPSLPRQTAAGTPAVELWANGRRLVKTSLEGVKPLGKLEVITPHGISGWIALAGQPDIIPRVEVLIDDVPYAVFSAEQRRSDLRRQKLNTRGGGFNLAWGRSPNGNARFNVSVRHFETGIELPGSPTLVTGAETTVRPLKPVRLPQQPVTILIIHSDMRPISEACLKSLQRNTRRAIAVQMIDTARDPHPLQTLRTRYSNTLKIQIDRISPSANDLTILNTVMRAAPGDIVVLDGRSQVGPRWLEQLSLAVGQNSRTGTASALTNAGGAFSVPRADSASPLPEGWDGDSASRAVAHAAYPLWPSMGLGNPACLYIRRSCFDDMGGFTPDTPFSMAMIAADFCLKSLRRGWQHIIDDRTLVTSEDVTITQTGQHPAYPEHGPLLEGFEQRADINTVRLRIASALMAPRPPRPRILYVIATRSGGTPQTNRDLMSAVSGDYEPYLLVCDGEQLSLFHMEDETTALEQHVLEHPIEPVLHVSAEYGDVVRDWLVRHAIELVHIRHLAWHSLDLPHQCAELGIPSIFSFHDYYMVCPSLKLLDENLTPCQGTCTAGQGPCVSELWHDARMPPLKHQYVHHWRSRSREMLEPCEAFVTTAPSAAHLIQHSLPELAQRLKVIPHGRTFERFNQVAVPVAPRSTFRILIAGGLSRAKGSALVSAAAKELLQEGVEFHLLGNADDGLDRNFVTCHGTYNRADFSQLAADIAPTIGLLPSLWPETYCHVLTEMWASGLPVLAYDIGAVGERVRTHGGGWLFGEPDVSLLCDVIRFLRAHPDELTGRIQEVRAWQAGEGRHQTNEAMGRAYADLYDHVLKCRPISTWQAPTWD